jgi:hypothetical protein
VRDGSARELLARIDEVTRDGTQKPGAAPREAAPRGAATCCRAGHQPLPWTEEVRPNRSFRPRGRRIGWRPGDCLAASP